MRLAAALLVVAALAGCGAKKPATSAAEVAPGSTYALVDGRSTPRLERALAFLPEAGEVRRLLARAVAVTGAGPRPTLAVLDSEGTQAVALTQAKIDGLTMPHARVRGWTVFSRQQRAVDAVRHAKTRLADLPGFGPASGDLTFVRRGRVVTVTDEGDHVVATRTEPRRARAAEHPLAGAIPADAVAAAAFHDGATALGSLAFAPRLKAGLGLTTTALAAVAPDDGVLYARTGDPAATVTLVAAGTRIGAARNVVRELAPLTGAGVPATLDGVSATVVGLGPIDLFYGTTDGSTFVTDDPDATVRTTDSPLDPDGLPAKTTEWAYLDVDRGLPALASLAALAGTRISPSFVRKLDGLRSLLVYRVRGSLVLSVGD